uniref:HTH OST-type domain-containing protein n=1 Tax=Anopheles epiroticus TaxID=199890 RepID=A0A182PCZ9_9DIPT
MKELKAILRSLVISNAERGMSASQLNNDFKKLEGCNIPFGENGFQSLDAMLRTLTDVVKVCGSGAGATVYPVTTEKNQHILEMVKKSKNNKKKKTVSSCTRKVPENPVPPMKKKKKKSNFYYANKQNSGHGQFYSWVGNKDPTRTGNPNVSYKNTGYPANGGYANTGYQSNAGYSNNGYVNAGQRNNPNPPPPNDRENLRATNFTEVNAQFDVFWNAIQPFVNNYYGRNAAIRGNQYGYNQQQQQQQQQYQSNYNGQQRGSCGNPNTLNRALRNKLQMSTSQHCSNSNNNWYGAGHNWQNYGNGAGYPYQQNFPVYYYPDYGYNSSYQSNGYNNMWDCNYSTSYGYNQYNAYANAYFQQSMGQNYYY